MSQKRTQTDRIIKYLKRGLTLTPLGALKMGMGMRLGARVFDLKQQGYKIETLRKSHKNYAHYKLKK